MGGGGGNKRYKGSYREGGREGGMEEGREGWKKGGREEGREGGRRGREEGEGGGGRRKRGSSRVCFLVVHGDGKSVLLAGMVWPHVGQSQFQNVNGMSVGKCLHGDRI